MTLSKKKGGLGFRDLYLFNKAMLARQAWRLLVKPETLCAQVLRAKYFKNTSLLLCTAREGISYSWRSILQGIELLKHGLIWRIGNGDHVNIWTDPWVPRGTTRKPATPRGASLLTRVSDLIDPATGTWDEQLVMDTFWPEDAEVILTIPTDSEMVDWPAWHYDKAGVFSVKSAYKLAIQGRDQLTGKDASSVSTTNEGDAFSWYKIWQTKLPNKVKMFIWRLAHNNLHVRRNLQRRGVKLDTICPLCNRLDEDSGHLFFKCKWAKECWRRMNLEQVRLDLEKCQSGKDTIRKIWAMQQNLQQQVFVLLWRWWSARNKVNSGGKKDIIPEVCSAISYYLHEFEQLSKSEKKSIHRPCAQWKPPPSGYYKLNVDASFFAESKKGGWGFVARDNDGVFLEAGAGNISRAADALQAEAMAALRGLEKAAELGMTRIVLETNAATLGNVLTSEVMDRSSNGCLFRQIRDFMSSQFVQFEISVCSRACNKVADCFAAYGACVLDTDSSVFWSDAPNFVTDLVSGDLLGTIS